MQKRKEEINDKIMDWKESRCAGRRKWVKYWMIYWPAITISAETSSYGRIRVETVGWKSRESWKRVDRTEWANRQQTSGGHAGLVRVSSRSQLHQVQRKEEKAKQTNEIASLTTSLPPSACVACHRRALRSERERRQTEPLRLHTLGCRTMNSSSAKWALKKRKT